MRMHRRPAWRWLYAVLPLMGVLMVAFDRVSLSPIARQVMEGGGVVLVYGLVWLWISANEEALESYDEDEETPEVVGQDEIVDGRKLILPYTPCPDGSEKILVYSARQNGKSKL